MMRRVLLAARRDDSGFGLIETVVALLIAGVIFSALAAVLISAIQASLFGRQNQQATDFMTRAVEDLRATDFGALANSPADVAADTAHLVSCAAGGKCLNVDGVLEPVVSATGGLSISPTIVATEANQTHFTIYRYVTKVPDQPLNSAKRVSVFITWTDRGLEHVRSMSTIVAYTQRGLPLPEFRLEPPVSLAYANPGGEVNYMLSLQNQGAPDRFNFTLASTGPGWAFYTDTDKDGQFDIDVDQLLGDTNSDGKPDTGRMDPGTTFYFFVVRIVPTVELNGTVMDATVRATSVGQSTIFAEAKITNSVLTGYIPVSPVTVPYVPNIEVTCPAASAPVLDPPSSGYTMREYALHNGITGGASIGDTPLQAQLRFDRTGWNEPKLAHYSTNVDPAATGRVIAPYSATAITGNSALDAALNSTDATKYADWALQFQNRGRIDGKGIVHLWIARYSTDATNISLKFMLYSGSGTATGMSRTLWVSDDVALGPITCAGFQEVWIKLPDINNKQLARNDWLGLRVLTIGTGRARLAYDVPGTFPATLIISNK